MGMNEVFDISLPVGTRISCDGYSGTVKFIGELETQDGLWCGVEWDDPRRGKHSGCYNGTHYFKTRIPNGGSFVRPRNVETGISCPEAIRRRYGKSEAENSVCINLPQKTGKLRVVEMVGFNKVMGKQSQFQTLTEVVVSRMLVKGPGEPGELQELVPNTSSLDLSGNLISSWADVADICEQLPLLNTLILSENRLKIDSNVNMYETRFKPLKMLVLNNMAYTWDEILSCAVMWPYIGTLYACQNDITRLKEPSFPIFSKLKHLNLDGNPITSFEEIYKLGNLSNLEELSLNDTGLQSICFGEVSPAEKTNLFSNLHSLSLRNNNLSEWQDISELNKLQKLKDLKIANNPIIMSVNPETAFQLVIAKITGIEKINKSEISRSDRRGAEIDYIKRYHKDWFACGQGLNDDKQYRRFLSEHPTYPALLKKHGAAEESEVTSHSSLLKNNLLSLEIFSSIVPEQSSVKKKLPASMPVCRMKALIRRIFNVSVDDMKLTCYNKDTGLGMQMDNDLRQLSFYSIASGDKIDVTW